MTFNKQADEILSRRFSTGKLIALATSMDNKPYVRAVNAYYENGTFYVMSKASTGKMKQMELNPEVALCGELFNGRGIAENIGHVLKDEHKELMKTLRIALAEWYEYGKVDENDPDNVILAIKLTEAGVIEDGVMHQLFI